MEGPPSFGKEGEGENWFPIRWILSLMYSTTRVGPTAPHFVRSPLGQTCAASAFIYKRRLRRRRQEVPPIMIEISIKVSLRHFTSSPWSTAAVYWQEKVCNIVWSTCGECRFQISAIVSRSFAIKSLFQNGNLANGDCTFRSCRVVSSSAWKSFQIRK